MYWSVQTHRSNSLSFFIRERYRVIKKSLILKTFSKIFYFSPIDYSQNPRVRDAGKANFLANKNGTGVALLIELQGRAIAPTTFRVREKPKNHMTTNAHKIKEIMRKAKEREAHKEHQKAEKNAPIKATEKFKDVQSKVKEMLQVFFKIKNYVI